MTLSSNWCTSARNRDRTNGKRCGEGRSVPSAGELIRLQTDEQLRIEEFKVRTWPRHNRCQTWRRDTPMAISPAKTEQNSPGDVKKRDTARDERHRHR